MLNGGEDRVYSQSVLSVVVLNDGCKFFDCSSIEGGVFVPFLWDLGRLLQLGESGRSETM